MDADTLRTFLLDICRAVDEGRPIRHKGMLVAAGLGLGLAGCQTTSLYGAPETPIETCDNQLDDDADGAIDCDDPDCSSDPLCEGLDTTYPVDTGYGAPFEDDCVDGVDNDSDGAIDCDDDDCFDDEACANVGLYAAPEA